MNEVVWVTFEAPCSLRWSAGTCELLRLGDKKLHSGRITFAFHLLRGIGHWSNTVRIQKQKRHVLVTFESWWCLFWCQFRQLAVEGILFMGCPCVRPCGSAITYWKVVSTISYKLFSDISPNLHLTFDPCLLTLKSSQFIFVSNCTGVVILVKIPRSGFILNFLQYTPLV